VENSLLGGSSIPILLGSLAQEINSEINVISLSISIIRFKSIQIPQNPFKK